MKIALITDTHVGVRGDNQLVAEFQNKFFYEFFFPYLKEHGIKRIFHLGDIADKRKGINFLSAKHLRKFLSTCEEIDVIVGNHDVFFKQNNEVNTMNEMVHDTMPTVKHYSEATEIELDGTKIALVPWINSGNYTASMEFLKNTTAQIVFGHLEIAGFQMYRGSVNEHGLSSSVFNKFDQVFSGHFHHKSSVGNIHYLGAPYEMTWSDYDDPRGFHLFDTDTRELTFIENPYKLFHKFAYSDNDLTVEDIKKFNFSEYKNKYLIINVESKTQPALLEMFVSGFEKAGALDVKVNENKITLSSSDEITTEVQDTLSIIKESVSNTEMSIDKSKLLNILENLYHGALTLD